MRVFKHVFGVGNSPSFMDGNPCVGVSGLVAVFCRGWIAGLGLAGSCETKGCCDECGGGKFLSEFQHLGVS